ncbi:MAG: Uma2 family endonuclease [Saprospiraceae bacterium]|nr:Uma2 family endonuclease [Saprospiraceae bacterium]
MITFQNLFIVQRIIRLFQKTDAFRKGAELFTEPQTMTSSRQLRIPDMAYYTEKQIAEAARGVVPTVPEFIIEFISDNDPHPKVLAKMEEYFNAGARVVWLVVPQVKTVYAYSSPVEVVICKNERECSAEAVLPGFKISAGELFA